MFYVLCWTSLREDVKTALWPSLYYTLNELHRDISHRLGPDSTAAFQRSICRKHGWLQKEKDLLLHLWIGHWICQAMKWARFWTLKHLGSIDFLGHTYISPLQYTFIHSWAQKILVSFSCPGINSVNFLKLHNYLIRTKPELEDKQNIWVVV